MAEKTARGDEKAVKQGPETHTAYLFHRPEGDPVFQRFLIHLFVDPSFVLI